VLAVKTEFWRAHGESTSSLCISSSSSSLSRSTSTTIWTIHTDTYNREEAHKDAPYVYAYLYL